MFNYFGTSDDDVAAAWAQATAMPAQAGGSQVNQQAAMLAAAQAQQAQTMAAQQAMHPQQQPAPAPGVNPQISARMIRQNRLMRAGGPPHKAVPGQAVTGQAAPVAQVMPQAPGGPPLMRSIGPMPPVAPPPSGPLPGMTPVGMAPSAARSGSLDPVASSAI